MLVGASVTGDSVMDTGDEVGVGSKDSITVDDSVGACDGAFDGDDVGWEVGIELGP